MFSGSTYIHLPMVGIKIRFAFQLFLLEHLIRAIRELSVALDTLVLLTPVLLIGKPNDFQLLELLVITPRPSLRP